MLVQDLIAKLEKLDPEMVVYLGTEKVVKNKSSKYGFDIVTEEWGASSVFVEEWTDDRDGTYRVVCIHGFELEEVSGFSRTWPAPGSVKVMLPKLRGRPTRR